MRWDAFAQACPEIARLAEERFARDQVVLVGTIRRGVGSLGLSKDFRPND